VRAHWREVVKKRTKNIPVVEFSQGIGLDQIV
jgi:hypothetical protein